MVKNNSEVIRLGDSEMNCFFNSNGKGRNTVPKGMKVVSPLSWLHRNNGYR